MHISIIFKFNHKLKHDLWSSFGYLMVSRHCFFLYGICIEPWHYTRHMNPSRYCRETSGFWLTDCAHPHYDNRRATCVRRAIIVLIFSLSRLCSHSSYSITCLRIIRKYYWTLVFSLAMWYLSIGLTHKWMIGKWLWGKILKGVGMKIKWPQIVTTVELLRTLGTSCLLLFCRIITHSRNWLPTSVFPRIALKNLNCSSNLGFLSLFLFWRNQHCTSNLVFFKTRLNK